MKPLPGQHEVPWLVEEVFYFITEARQGPVVRNPTVTDEVLTFLANFHRCQSSDPPQTATEGDEVSRLAQTNEYRPFSFPVCVQVQEHRARGSKKAFLAEFINVLSQEGESPTEPCPVCSSSAPKASVEQGAGGPAPIPDLPRAGLAEVWVIFKAQCKGRFFAAALPERLGANAATTRHGHHTHADPAGPLGSHERIRATRAIGGSLEDHASRSVLRQAWAAQRPEAEVLFLSNQWLQILKGKHGFHSFSCFPFAYLQYFIRRKTNSRLACSLKA